MYLDNVPEENCFVLSNGAKLRNLEELLLALKSSDESLFYNHVTNERNDFANWIRACIKHETLANILFDARQRQKFIDILESEILFIRSPKLRETERFFHEDSVIDQVKVSSVSAQVPPAIPIPIVDDKSSKIAVVNANGANSNNLSSSAVVLLDFGQFLQSIVQEIDQEIFQWSE